MAGLLTNSMPACIWNIYSYLTFLAPSVEGTTNSNLKGRQQVLMFHALLFKMCYTPRAGIVQNYFFNVLIQHWNCMPSPEHTHCTLRAFIVQRSQQIGNWRLRLLRTARLKPDPADIIDGHPWLYHWGRWKRNRNIIKNIARIANAVQVTICLLVSTSVY